MNHVQEENSSHEKDLFLITARFEEMKQEQDGLLQEMYESIGRYQKQVGALTKQNKCLEYLRPSSKSNNVFVVVLVDAEDAVFRDELLQSPQNGAKEAAMRLKGAVKESLATNLVHNYVGQGITILVQVFGNIKNIGKKLYESDMIGSRNDFAAFTENFTDSCPEFSFINVGSGKEKAGMKMSNMLRYFHSQCQCKKIFFVGCHKDHYLDDLTALSVNHNLQEKIVLVETTPANLSFRALPLDIIQFENVFRSTPLSNDGVALPSAGDSPYNYTPTRTPPTNESSPTPWSRASKCNSNITLPSTTGNKSTNAERSLVLRAPKSNTISTELPACPLPRTGSSTKYLTLGGPKPPRIIYYNEDERRIDPPNERPSDKEAFQLFSIKLSDIQVHHKKRGFCNYYPLIGPEACSRGEQCSMDHGTVLCDRLLQVQRYRAREQMCNTGPMCKNFACFHSHHCPYEPRCSGNCKFKLHFKPGSMDTQARYQWVEGETEKRLI